ncbi:NfeD family protein [Azonexus sp.]|uniref:NfeD family protein n=1 Tax=Azonexus sp. TaxID=1872668 RepID=UPI0039E71CF2
MDIFLHLEWWHWIVGGMALILAELAIPAFYVIWFGLGALLVGLALLLVDFSPTLQILLWSISSLSFAALWFRFFRHGERTLSGTAAGEVIGEIGLAVAAIAPFEKGRVRFQRPLLGAEEWVCLADGEIAAGDRVRVLAIEGNYFRVGKQ